MRTVLNVTFQVDGPIVGSVSAEGHVVAQGEADYEAETNLDGRYSAIVDATLKARAMCAPGTRICYISCEEKRVS